MDVKALLNRIILESKREDKHFIKLEFNIRRNQVVMNYIYEDRRDGDIHLERHDADPEFMDLDTFESLKIDLNEVKIPYQERRDEFL